MRSIIVLILGVFILFSCCPHNTRKIIDANIKVIKIRQEEKKNRVTYIIQILNGNTQNYEKVDSLNTILTQESQLSDKEIRQLVNSYYVNKLDELPECTILNYDYRKEEDDYLCKIIVEIQTNLGLQKIIMYTKIEIDDIVYKKSLLEKIITTKTLIKEERINRFISNVNHILQ
ncbi:MAG: hypothetical protein J6581_09895 [Apibacter sp.]|nr:hypothetical protein [Apibacter sp.]